MLRSRVAVPVFLSVVGGCAVAGVGDSAIAPGDPMENGILRSGPEDTSGPFVSDGTAQRLVGRVAEVSAVPMREALRARRPGKRPHPIARPPASPTAKGNGIDWNVATGSAVTSAPATTGPGWDTASPQDSLFFAVSGTATNGQGINGTAQVQAGWAAAAQNAKLFKLSNLYGTKPDLIWYALDATNGVAFDYSAVALNGDGSQVYALSTNGRLYCFAAGASGPAAGAATVGTACAGWPAYPNNYYSAGANTAYSSPWFDFVTGDVFFGDVSGKIHRVNGANGTSYWAGGGATLAATQSSPVLAPTSLSSPLVWDGVAYVGDDSGRFWRVRNLGTKPYPESPDVASIDLCGSAPGTCATNPWAIRSSPAMDVGVGKVYAAAGGNVFEFPAGATGNWQPSGARQKQLLVGATLPMYSSPALDWEAGWLYVGFNNSLYKVRYPISGTATQDVFSAAVSSAGADQTYPRGAPLAYNSSVYLATSTILERYACAEAASAVPAALTSVSNASYGASTVTSLMIDWRSGNVNFGYSAGIVQFKQIGSPDWTCPTTLPISVANLACNTNPECIAKKCTGNGTNGGCSNNNGTTRLCNTTTGVCYGACAAGYADCNNDKNDDGCETLLPTDPQNCGACGTACSTNNITLPTCTAGVCGGTCDPGFADCNHSVSDGCEQVVTATSCCGVTCGSGQICGQSACVAGVHTVCATVSEHQAAQIACPVGTHVTSVNYASYGTPTGTCPTFTNGTCHATTSLAIVQAECLNQTSCVVLAENAQVQAHGGVLGDPCAGTFKKLYIRVSCSY
jgi:hypothetical protein